MNPTNPTMPTLKVPHIVSDTDIEDMRTRLKAASASHMELTGRTCELLLAVDKMLDDLVMARRWHKVEKDALAADVNMLREENDRMLNYIDKMHTEMEKVRQGILTEEYYESQT